MRTVANTPSSQQKTIICVIRPGCEFVQQEIKSNIQTQSLDLKGWATTKSLKSHMNICEKACCVLEERLNHSPNQNLKRSIEQAKHKVCLAWKKYWTRWKSSVYNNHSLNQNLKKKSETKNPCVWVLVFGLYWPKFMAWRK